MNQKALYEHSSKGGNVLIQKNIFMYISNTKIYAICSIKIPHGFTKENPKYLKIYSSFRKIIPGLTPGGGGFLLALRAFCCSFRACATLTLSKT